MRILTCLTQEHDLRVVALAALICALGAYVTVRLFQQMREAEGKARDAWRLLGAMAAGPTIWCTHFVAMLAYRPELDVAYEPRLTGVSFMIAVVGAGASMALAMRRDLAWAPAVGGALFGLAVVAMHYIGMMAFAVQGIILWAQAYVVASVVMALLFGAAAFHAAATRQMGWAVALVILTIVSLHFTGMAAMEVLPLAAAVPAPAGEGHLTLAMAITGLALLLFGVGGANRLLEEEARQRVARGLPAGGFGLGGLPMPVPAAGPAVPPLRVLEERPPAPPPAPPPQPLEVQRDTLTGLPRHAAFFERLDELASQLRPGSQIAVLAIEADRLKEVNGLHGHAAGDTMLAALARGMAQSLREGEFLARFGGGEFAAVAVVPDREEAREFAERLRRQLQARVQLGDTEIVCDGSIGVALMPQDAEGPTALVTCADLAMHLAKANPARRIRFYEEATEDAVRERRRMTQELRDALARGQFRLVWQSQVSTQSGRIVGREALLRWEHPVRGPIPPADFIALAEESGLMPRLGEWVLIEACRQAAQWPGREHVSVNLSVMQLVPDLHRAVADALAEAGLPPDRLELEITEASVSRDPERTARLLEKLRAIGVSIAMDDYGRGSMSLTALRELPLDCLKLDHTLMQGLEDGPQALATIRALIALGKSLGLKVVAEGVETREQLELLRREGCDEAQGFLFGPPAEISRAAAG
ncbi:EAL domain-containing protein [Rhodovarius crocodyli]|uniref:EAL domain-containing protein n=1 Tax=Rhodovarius crocodyli TaxID=1979269 RepID=A0A437MFF5_9PROT|nr:EAL domain-containing protein [Rhodovarius crocodyli]RVT96367.1 EAL domain-containing protein [Rhodovarius crocodyli]